MTIVFRYLHIPRADGTLRHAPYIPILLRTKFDKLVKVIALLDSGADETVLPYDLAELLGLTTQGEAFDTGGIGGSVKVKATRLPLTIEGKRESYHLNIRALILQEKEADIPLILGRHGFFEEFQITFKQDQEKIILKKVQPKIRY